MRAIFCVVVPEHNVGSGRSRAWLHIVGDSWKLGAGEFLQMTCESEQTISRLSASTLHIIYLGRHVTYSYTKNQNLCLYIICMYASFYSKPRTLILHLQVAPDQFLFHDENKLSHTLNVNKVSACINIKIEIGKDPNVLKYKKTLLYTRPATAFVSDQR